MSATDTAYAESAQAIFCAMADFLGASKAPQVLNLKKYPTFEDFEDDKNNKKYLKTALTRVTVDMPVDKIYDYIRRKKDWYISSVLIANKIVKDLKTIDSDFTIDRKGFNDGKMFYLRGDEDVMKIMDKLFALARDSKVTKVLYETAGVIPIRQINKWSPADIYFANPISKNRLADELADATRTKDKYTFQRLNKLIKELIDEGALLPLSLKKTTTNVKLEKVNFSRAAKEKILDSVKFKGTNDWKPYVRLNAKGIPDKKAPLRDSFNGIKKGGQTNTRTLKMNIEIGGSSGHIGFRHDPSSSRLVVEFIGGSAEARGGSVASVEILSKIIGCVSKTQARYVLNAYNKGNEKFKQEKNKLQKDKSKLRTSKGNVISAKLTAYDHFLAIASGENIANAVFGGQFGLMKYFNNPRNRKDVELFVRILFQYVTSRDPKSARFVVAK